MVPTGSFSAWPTLRSLLEHLMSEDSFWEAADVGCYQDAFEPRVLAVPSYRVVDEIDGV